MPQRKKAAKKKWNSSKNDFTKYMEEIICKCELSLKQDLARIEANKARHAARIKADDARHAVKIKADKARDAANERHKKLLRQEREKLRRNK